MKSFRENKRLIRLVVIIPLLLVGQYFMFSKGVISPIVKGVEIKIIGGNYIKDLDKYIIKLGDDVEISAGNYVKIPGYAKDPKLWFNALDDNGIIEIKDNKITALKEGYTSVAVMKGNRLIKKAMLKVVNPDVESLDMDLSDELKYVGDKATISSSVAISDYQKFKDTYKAKYLSSDESILKIDGDKVEAVGVGTATISGEWYLSSDESILKIDGDKVEAVGVGTATISGECGDKLVEIPLKIEAKVSKLEVANEFILEEGQTTNINPKVTTSPKGLKPPKVEYRYADRKKKSDRATKVSSSGKISAIREGSEKIVVSCGEKERIIKVTVKKRSVKNSTIKNITKVSSSGKISAIREGSEKIVVSCGEKERIIKVTVKKRSVKNSTIKNINYSYEVGEENIKLEVSWDSLEGIKSYDIYVKDYDDEEYNIIQSVSQSEEKEGKINTTLEIGLSEIGENQDKSLEIYIVGVGEKESTKPSDKIIIKY